MGRDTIFISHATPNDNDFVRWLGTRLTGHGYKVWADLFEMKGGTPFWSTIEEALRHHACKVIFVVSKNSVGLDRTGVRNELSVADAMKKTLKDAGFIIPVKIDDTAFSELPIQVHQLNAIDFAKGWGPKLVELLDTLEGAKVPKVVGDQTAEFKEAGAYPVGQNVWKQGHREFLPLYEGKIVQAFDHRASDILLADGNLFRTGQGRDLSLEEHKNPDRVPVPRYWVDSGELDWAPPTNWCLAIKDVTSVTNARTTIAAAIPRVGAGHTLPVIFPKKAGDKTYPELAVLLLANLNSVALDYLATGTTSLGI